MYSFIYSFIYSLIYLFIHYLIYLLFIFCPGTQACTFKREGGGEEGTERLPPTRCTWKSEESDGGGGEGGDRYK